MLRELESDTTASNFKTNAAISVLTGVLLSLTLLQTKFGVPRLDGTRVLARVNLSDISFSTLSPEDLDVVSAREKFRSEWCKRQGLEQNVCWFGERQTVADYQLELRRSWCRSIGIQNPRSCTLLFSELDGEFELEWQKFRQAKVEAIQKPDFSGRDLRNADFSRSTLIGVNFIGSNLAGANFSDANLEHAVFTCHPDFRAPDAVPVGGAFGGRLISTMSSEECARKSADLSNADFGRSNLVSSDFRYANLESADFSGAVLDHANMSNSRPVGAMFFGSRLYLVNLHQAELEGANFTSAQLLTSNFSEAILNGSRTRRINNPRIRLHEYFDERRQFFYGADQLVNI